MLWTEVYLFNVYVMSLKYLVQYSTILYVFMFNNLFMWRFNLQWLQLRGNTREKSYIKLLNSKRSKTILIQILYRCDI